MICAIFNTVLKAIVIFCMLHETVCNDQNPQTSWLMKAMTQDEYMQLRGQIAPTQTRNDVHDQHDTQINVSTHKPSPIIFIPSFQGTLLGYCESINQCTPLYLSPLAPRTYQRIYSLLSDKLNSNVKPLLVSFGSFENIEYPSYTCGTSPFSHIGHCNPFPAKGYIDELKKHLETKNYIPLQNLFAIGYDWRQNKKTILSSEPFSTYVPSLLRQQSDSTIIAHGTGCKLLHEIVRLNIKSNIKRVICLSPLPSKLAEESLSDGEGLMTMGDEAHRYVDVMTSARAPGRIDFRAMEFELGLRPGRRTSVADIAGAWDEKELKFGGTKEERRELARNLDAIKELANESEKKNGMNISSVCVVSRENENESWTLCSGYDRVMVSNANHTNLVGLMKDIV